MALTIVAAVNRRGVIGREGGLPWHLPEELKHFASVTKGKPVVMGRRTFESLPPTFTGGDRRLLVVTRDSSYRLPPQIEGEVFSTPTACLPLAEGEEVMVAGGEQIYRALLPYASSLTISRLPSWEEGDCYFPALAPEEWKLLYRVNKGSFQVDTWRRKGLR